MKTGDDILLLNRLKKGDLEAYEHLFKRHYKQLVVHAFYMLKDEMEAEDLVQNIFVDMWEQQHYANIQTSFQAYITRAVTNRCLNLIEKNKNALNRYNQYLSDFDEAETQEEETSFGQKLNEKLTSVLNELPAQRYQAVNMVYLEDKKYKEAALEMGITVNSVKTHLKLALKFLRQKL